MSTFRIVVLVVFVVFAVVGVAIFAGVGGFFGSDSGEGAPVLIWGTLPGAVMTSVLGDLVDARKGFDLVTYVAKDPRTYEADFVEALATGSGPDLLLLPHDLLVSHANKLIAIPYSSFSERAFKDAFIEEGELFLSPQGIIGLPFLVDPMVMYWNRAIFATEGVAKPPAYWDEFFLLAPKMTKRDQASNITRSFVSLGEYGNVTHAKALLSALMMQAGNRIVERGTQGLTSVLTEGAGTSAAGAEAALRFYTEFSNPVKSVYSWNRALPESRQMFLAGDLGVYFGFASELSELRRANPNLNFDVASLPQSRDAADRTTYGRLSALVIPRIASNANAALSAAFALSDAPSLSALTALTGLPPVRRDLLAKTPTDAFQSVFYASALQAKAWLDPNPKETERIFRAMVEGITSGRENISGALRTAHSEISNLLR